MECFLIHKMNGHIQILFYMLQLSLSTSINHDPYIDFCVTPRKELLLDFKVECDHLDDIPSAEFSRTKTKKRIK